MGLLRAMVIARKRLRDNFISEHVILGKESCNLCRNKIASQVERKLVECNSALNECCFKLLSKRCSCLAHLCHNLRFCLASAGTAKGQSSLYWRGRLIVGYITDIRLHPHKNSKIGISIILFFNGGRNWGGEGRVGGA